MLVCFAGSSKPGGCLGGVWSAQQCGRLPKMSMLRSGARRLKSIRATRHHQAIPGFKKSRLVQRYNMIQRYNTIQLLALLWAVELEPSGSEGKSRRSGRSGRSGRQRRRSVSEGGWGIPWLSVAWLLIADDCWSFGQNLDNNWLQEIWRILCQGCRLVTPMIGFKTALAFCRIVHVQHKVFDWIDLNRAFARTGSRHFTQNVYINVL